MNKIIGLSTMAGGSFVVGEAFSQFIICDIKFTTNDVVEVNFENSGSVLHIPYHNVASWFVQEE